MKYRYMGETGLLVSRICLGSHVFGERNWGCDKKTSIEIINHFLDRGGNFVDTADIYNNGISEEIIGEAIRMRKRDEIVLATKCFHRMNNTPNAKGLSRKHIIEACDASLTRLKTDFIDLYLIHGPDPFTPMEETMRTMDDLVRLGKVRYIGCCNMYAWQIVKANGISRQLNLERLSCAEYLYNLIVRDVEQEILPACCDQGMGFLCWSPLAAGMLSGKYQKTEKPLEGSRIAFRGELEIPRYWHERGFRIVAEVKAVGRKIGRSPAQVALAWLLHERRVTAVIIGARNTDQLGHNLEVGDWDMPEETWKMLNQVTQYAASYPKSWIDSAGVEPFGEEEF